MEVDIFPPFRYKCIISAYLAQPVKMGFQARKPAPNRSICAGSVNRDAINYPAILPKIPVTGMSDKNAVFCDLPGVVFPDSAHFFKIVFSHL